MDEIRKAPKSSAPVQQKLGASRRLYKLRKKPGAAKAALTLNGAPEAIAGPLVTPPALFNPTKDRKELMAQLEAQRLKELLQDE